jgi:hypothetical protein
LLTKDGDRPNSLAAAEKLFFSTTRTKIAMSFKFRTVFVRL